MIPTILTLREGCSGGGMLSQVLPSKSLMGISPLTILIHGYNNTACAAGQSYGGFLGLPEVDRGDVLATLGEVCEFFWPGDSRLLKGASYALEIPLAIRAAQRLSEFLAGLARGRQSPLVVRLICHSLGNRVALECLKHYFAQPSPPPLRVEGSLLMAAAVLVNMVEDSHALQGAARKTGSSLVLFSEHDPVLHWAFPPGEFLSGEGVGIAVGRFGEPRSGLWQDDLPMDGYGHGDYWAGQLTGGRVRHWLGLATVQALATRTPLANDPPEARELSRRALTGRTIGAPLGACDCHD